PSHTKAPNPSRAFHASPTRRASDLRTIASPPASATSPNCPRTSETSDHPNAWRQRCRRSGRVIQHIQHGANTRGTVNVQVRARNPSNPPSRHATAYMLGTLRHIPYTYMHLSPY